MPKTIVHAMVRFTEDECDLLSELLRLAQQDLLRTHATLQERFPASPLLEMLLTFAERAADLRERIEER
jgi:hypothetical protein